MGGFENFLIYTDQRQKTKTTPISQEISSKDDSDSIRIEILLLRDV
jgi:hypothetical protein